jgi:hypothetical protein
MCNYSYSDSHLGLAPSDQVQDSSGDIKFFEQKNEHRESYHLKPKTALLGFRKATAALRKFLFCSGSRLPFAELRKGKE